jgi:hypothetical protein
MPRVHRRRVRVVQAASGQTFHTEEQDVIDFKATNQYDDDHGSVTTTCAVLPDSVYGFPVCIYTTTLDTRHEDKPRESCGWLTREQARELRDALTEALGEGSRT